MTATSPSLKFLGAGNGNGLPDNFPEGLRVMVVDDDPTCLMIIDKKLQKCKYEVTLCNKAETAITLLRENKNVCDIVLTDVHMPDMDGFKLLTLIGLEMDIPVIMMSADASPSIMMKGIDHGACDYIIKPVSVEALRSIWLHVVKSRKPKCRCHQALIAHDEVNQPQKLIEYVDCTSPENERHARGKMLKRRIDIEDEYEEHGESSSSKKPRVVWTIELHQRFVEAINILGVDRAVPKKILEIMGVPGITRENVASHLQKYRLYLKRKKNTNPNDIDTAIMDFLSRTYGVQGLGGRGQFSGQPLPPLQTTLLDRLSNTRSLAPMSATGQRNRFLFEDPRFHGYPTNVEPKSYLGMTNPSHQYPFNGVNSQAIVPMAGHSNVQNPFSNGMLASDPGSNVSGNGIGPSYNYYNSNMLNADTGPQNMTYTSNRMNADPGPQKMPYRSNRMNADPGPQKEPYRSNRMNAEPVPQKVPYSSNRMNADPDHQNMSFTDWMNYPTSPTMGPSSSFAFEGSGTHGNSIDDNQHDLLSSLLDQTMEGDVGQMGNELDFDAYNFDDLPGAT